MLSAGVDSCVVKLALYFSCISVEFSEISKYKIGIFRNTNKRATDFALSCLSLVHGEGLRRPFAAVIELHVYP